MINVLQQFKAFLSDEEAAELYITGIAGTGKTTSLNSLLSYCSDNKIEAIATAYTHKACSVLKSKLNKEAKISTLHSFLKKCPTINNAATKVTNIDGNKQVSTPDKVAVLFIDEFSMIGEKDFVDIACLQYGAENGELLTKVVYIGDPNQLPPVKDIKAVVPHGDHWIKLTKVYRQENDNPLIDTLLQLNSFIDGAKLEPLKENANFVRNCDIVNLYRKCTTTKVILAYTNAQVETLNAAVQGRHKPKIEDNIFSPSTRKIYTLNSVEDKPPFIIDIRGKILELGSKYGTLETLQSIKEVSFFTLTDYEDNETARAVIFGHQRYLNVKAELGKLAVQSNKNITLKYGIDAKVWAQSNWREPLAKLRSSCWKRYLSFKNNVICVDFVHAMTVHKSQGSTYENVFLDTIDISKSADFNYNLYLKLLYVAISRASDKVYTN